MNQNENQTITYIRVPIFSSKLGLEMSIRTHQVRGSEFKRSKSSIQDPRNSGPFRKPRWASPKRLPPMDPFLLFLVYEVGGLVDHHPKKGEQEGSNSQTAQIIHADFFPCRLGSITLGISSLPEEERKKDRRIRRQQEREGSERTRPRGRMRERSKRRQEKKKKERRRESHQARLPLETSGVLGIGQLTSNH